MKKNIIIYSIRFLFIWMFFFAITAGNEIKAQTCASPTNLTFGSTLINQSTCGTGNDFSQNDACGNTFLNGEDYVYSYTPTLAGVNDCIAIDIVGLAGDINRAIFVFDDCPDITGTNCVAQAVTTTGLQVSIDDLQLNIGTTYLIVVSSGFNCHSFNIALGSGNCSPTQTGDNCASSNIISSLPFSIDNLTTCGAGNDYNSGNISCNSQYIGGEDYIFQYTPINDECIRIDLSNTSSYTGLYVLNACPSDPNKTCIASEISAESGNPSIPYVALGAGKTYYIIVSSYNLITPCTNFDINISSIACCGVGSTCYFPDAITALPFLQNGRTTCGSCNDYNSTMGCGGGSELLDEDYVYSYTAPSDECVFINLTGANANASITLFDGCPEDITTNCLATGSANLNASLVGGQTYFIVISSQQNCTPFNIGIINFALPPGFGPGENCANPFVIPALPFTQDSLTSACFGNDYSLNATTSCGGIVTNGEDFVFAYTSPGGESVNIELSNTTQNVGLYVLNGCPDDPSSSCIAYEAPSPFNRNPALCGVVLTNPGIYYIVTDRPLGFTDFNISIQQSPSPGQNCINSYPINSLPFNLTGQTTRCYVNDYNPNTVCGQGILPPSMNGDDFIFTYSSPGGESLNIRLSNADINTGLFILDRCPDAIGVTCLGSSSGTNPSLCSVSLSTTGIYYIIVDKNAGFTPFNIDIELDQNNDSGTDCVNPYLITDLPFTQTGFTTACYGNDYNSTHACGSSYMNGEDFVFEFTIASTACLQITANNLSASGGLYVLNNCPDVPGATCIAQDTCNFAEGCNSLALNSSFSPGTYYIVVSSSSTAANLNFNLSLDTVHYDATIAPVEKICLFEKNTLFATTAGGIWSGPGITDANNGLFDGSVAGTGTHTIHYAVGPGSCSVRDSIQIEVVNNCNCLPNLFVQNPSFEGNNPQIDAVPGSWDLCFPSPDIQPGAYNVSLPPSHGNSYIGMCECTGIREWISSQQMSNPMIAGRFYLFTIDLARVPLDTSSSSFITGTCIGIQIWGGFSSCNPEELLWRSGSVDSITWETYNVSFTPGADYTHIMILPINLACSGCQDTISVSITSPSTSTSTSTCPGTCPYIIIDNISPIIPIYPHINISSISASFAQPCTYDVTGTTDSIPTSITLFGDFIGSPLNIPVTGLNWQANLSYPSSFGDSSTIIALATFSSECTDSDSITIDVIDIVPAFFASGFCYEETTVFNDTSTISVGNIDSWSWNFGDGAGTSNQQNTFYTYAAPGTYNVTLTVTTDAGCLDSVIRTIAIYDVIASAGSDDTICQGNNYALAGIIAGDAHYIVWETMGSGVFDNDSLLNPIYTPSANDILAGSVELIITAFDSTFTCSTSDTMTLIIPKELFLISSATNPPCGQSNGEICIVADGGIAPYNYQWNDANNQTDSCASNLPAGIYQVTVSDANNNCTTIAIITLSNLNGPLVEIDSVAHVTCNGGSDGSGIIAVSGGDAPYIFTWTPAVSTNDTALNLSAGNYICGVTDFVGCIQFVTLTITQPDSISVTTSSTPPTSCGTNTGSATIIPSGGTPPYTYLWSAEAGGQITATANNLNPGVYSCTVSDINECTQTFSVIVNDLNGPVVTLVSQTPVSCKRGDDGSAVISATGGLAPYTYSWSPQGGTSNAATNLSSGTYTVTVRDANNCTGSLAVTITELDSLSSEVSSDDTICPGTGITLNAIAQGGTPPYSYNWNPGAMGGSSVTVTPAVSTTYTVAVTDANNCTAAPQSVNVDIYALPVMSFSADPKEGCAPLCVSFSNITPNVNIVNWEFGDGQVASGLEVSHCYPQAGNYSPTLTVTDNNGCANSLTAPDLIKVFPNPVADFTTTPPNSSPVSSAILFNNESIGASHWLWNFGDFHNSSSKQKNPIFTYHEPGSYLVNLSVASNMGCTDTVSHTLIIEPGYTLYIPNAFSPDDDGVNDFFAPKGAEFISFEMDIYNRWGERIYHTTDIDKPWNGRSKSGNAIQEGVYVYKIWVKDFKEEIHYYVGNVSLIK